MIRVLMVLACLLVAPTVQAQSSGWAEHVISGMYGPPSAAASAATGGAAPFRLHDAVPDAMPTSWSWSKGAVKMRWNSMKAPTAEVRETPILTGRFGDAVPDTHGKNYRMHVRSYELWYFAAADRKWKLLDAATAWGAHYAKRDFSKTASIEERPEGDGSVSFPARADNWVHFYTDTWPYRVPPENFLYLHARAQLKLSGPDAAAARVLGSVGIDYKAIGSDGRSVNGYVVPAALSAAMKLLSTDYQWVTATTMTPAEIRATPPPAPPGWNSTPAPLPPPTPEPERPQYAAILQQVRDEHRALGETIDRLADVLEE